MTGPQGTWRHLAYARQVLSAFRLDGRAEAVSCDLADLEALPPVVDHTSSAFGRLDILVNNVGGTAPRAFLDTSPGYLERAFHFNVTVAFQLSRLAVPLLLAGDHGSIINLSSAMARLRDRGFVANATAKSAVSHLTRQMSIDLSPRIRVNEVAPGTIETEVDGGQEQPALGLGLPDL